MSAIYGQYAPQGAAFYNSPAAEETKLVKTGPGILHGFTVGNYNAATRFVFLFDGVSATGTPICPPLPVPASGVVSLRDGYGLPFAIGLFVAASSTGATFTASASADLRMTAITK